MSDARRAPGLRLPAPLRTTEAGLVLALALLLVVIYLLDPRRTFFGPVNLRNLMHDSALFGVLAVGAAVVIIAGGIDLSVGSVVALTGIIAAKLLNGWLPGTPLKSTIPLPWHYVAIVIAAALAIGLAVGGLHALLINRLKLPPFIATLATMTGLRSLGAVLSENRTIDVPWPAFRVFGDEPWVAVAVFLTVAAVIGTLMGTTVLGRHLYALGGNEAAARLSGLDTARLKTIAYMLSGALAALAGILFAGNVGQVDSRMGATYELFAITAAVVGGCSLAGGVGTIHGTLLGLIVIQVVIKGTALVIKGIDTSRIQGLVLGIVVVLAVAINQRVRGTRGD